MSKKSKSIKDFVPFSDEMVLLQLEIMPAPCNIIQAYTPTCDAANQALKDFYADIKKAFKANLLNRPKYLF